MVEFLLLSLLLPTVLTVSTIVTKHISWVEDIMLDGKGDHNLNVKMVDTVY